MVFTRRWPRSRPAEIKDPGRYEWMRPGLTRRFRWPFTRPALAGPGFVVRGVARAEALATPRKPAPGQAPEIVWSARLERGTTACFTSAGVRPVPGVVGSGSMGIA